MSKQYDHKYPMRATSSFLAGTEISEIGRALDVPATTVRYWLQHLTGMLPPSQSKHPTPRYLEMARNLIGEGGIASLRAKLERRRERKTQQLTGMRKARKRRVKHYTFEKALDVAKYLLAHPGYSFAGKASRKFGVRESTVSAWKVYLFDGRIPSCYRAGVPPYLKKVKKELQTEGPKAPKEQVGKDFPISINLLETLIGRGFVVMITPEGNIVVGPKK